MGSGSQMNGRNGTNGSVFPVRTSRGFFSIGEPGSWSRWSRCSRGKQDFVLPQEGSACCWSDRFTSLSAKEVSPYHCPSNDGCEHLRLIPVMALTLYHQRRRSETADPT